MSTTTYIPGHSTQKTKNRGFFRRLLDRLIYAQSLAAARMVGNHFRALPTQQLEDLGFSDAEIKRLRRGQPISNTQ